ncbi:hypothetical protein [Fodinibius sp. SL11]|uniref:hypothetical protein n=1 Tax=Fodinibius sp. SL11 TaxID=3425690 RepID=UPI003F8856EF
MYIWSDNITENNLYNTKVTGDFSSFKTHFHDKQIDICLFAQNHPFYPTMKANGTHIISSSDSRSVAGISTFRFRLRRRALRAQQ